MVRTLHSLDRRVQYRDGIEPTDLLPTREQADAINTHRLEQLPSPLALYEYRGVDTPGRDPEGRPIPQQIYEKMISRITAPQVISLKVR